jgi:hypothetical protein
MRILVLIIASHNKSEYLQMEAIWKSRRVPEWCSMWLLHSKPACEWVGDLVNDCFIDSENVEVDLQEKTLYFKQDECLIPGILAKTVAAIEFLGKIEDTTFDYVWRTNLSSVLDFDGLYNYCLSLNGGKFNGGNKFYGGYMGFEQNERITFASGAGFLMSKDVADYLVLNKESLRWDLIDDVAIGALLEPVFGLVHIERQWVHCGDAINRDVFHYRCESWMHQDTVKNMESVLNAIMSPCNAVFTV